MATNNIVPYATGAGANVLTDAAFQALPARFTGLTSGRAPSPVFNKPMRMGSVALSVLGQIVADYAGVDANDDGNVTGLEANLRIALAQMLSGVAYAEDQSSIANVLTVTLDPVPVSLNSYRRIVVYVRNTNTGPATINVNAFGARNITRRDGTPLQAYDLPAGLLADLIYSPRLGQFVLAGLGYAEVQRLVSGAVFYVAPGGSGSDANSGSQTAPLASIQGAASAANQIATTGVPITIKLLAPGGYAMPNQIFRPGGSFIILGDLANQAGYILSGAGTTSNPPLTAYGTAVDVRGLTLQNTGTVADTCAATVGGALSLTNVTFLMTQVNPFWHIASYLGGNVTINGGCQFSSPAGGWLRSLGGNVSISQSTLTFNGVPAWATAGIYCTAGGRIQPVGVPTIAGSATGVRYYVDSNGLISSAGQGTAFYPGSNVGSTASGGQYT